MAKFWNILRQAVQPNRAVVMVQKIVKRLRDPSGSHDAAENLAWITTNRSNFEELAKQLDASLWEETVAASKRLDENAQKVLATIPHKLGGSAMHPLLYFLTRHLKPAVIVETGVATGYSSAAFLQAITHNGQGRLYSSDFPYFRIENPERYIGVVVPEALKANWDLHIEGDAKNLPLILASAGTVDLFHYDSDKSYSGREEALQLIEPALSTDAVILMDDIDDNSFFYDLVEHRFPNAISRPTSQPTASTEKAWHIFEFQGRHVGMIGRINP